MANPLLDVQTLLRNCCQRRATTRIKPRSTYTTKCCVTPISQNSGASMREFKKYVLDEEAQQIWLLWWYWIIPAALTLRERLELRRRGQAGGHNIPGGGAIADMINRRKLPREVERLGVGGRRGGDQSHRLVATATAASTVIGSSQVRGAVCAPSAAPTFCANEAQSP
jgi:hypothetical protein